ncbi:MAG: preprotein translocase subunit SecA, partial [Alphaproteobacteria bacterium]
DEARTPLIISGPSEDSSTLYRHVNGLIPRLRDEHFEKDEKTRTVALTEVGAEAIEGFLREADLLTEGGLYDIANVGLVHHVQQALRAHKLFARDTDYIVKDGKVVIIDEFTGRMMEGRRYSEGLHQALEAKEAVDIQTENQTLASITYQNYFRLYPKLAGMTGTAVTEAAEFGATYNLDVIEIPTNVRCVRADHDDEVYRTAKEKHDAVIALIEDCHGRGQPMLVGTVSIEKSEHLSALLKKRKIPHNVLNARYHEQEAHIIAQAGRPGAVTIATNMAGRGTDIQLGGNVEMRIADELGPITDEAERVRLAERIRAEVAEAKRRVIEAGGLYVVGTERHESRRIDNQLRGRSGRQGDPGASKFFLSLEDDLMRIFGSERLDGTLRMLGLQEGEAIVHNWVNKAIEKAQTKVEARHFEARKTLLKFDNVMNDQRRVIYEQRREIMAESDVSETLAAMRVEVIADAVARHVPERAYPEQWDCPGLHAETLRILGLDLAIADWAKEEGIADEEIRERVTAAIDERMADKERRFTPAIMRLAEKSLLLQILDHKWREHLLALDHLRQGINLRAYAQRDPLNEYKRESFDLFDAMLGALRETVVSVLANLEIRAEVPQPKAPTATREGRADPALAQSGNGARRPAPPTQRAAPAPSGFAKVGRNEPCPCGSGKKYKHCHGQVA